MLQLGRPRRRRRPHATRLDPRRHPPRPPLSGRIPELFGEAARFWPPHRIVGENGSRELDAGAWSAGISGKRRAAQSALAASMRSGSRTRSSTRCGGGRRGRRRTSSRAAPSSRTTAPPRPTTARWRGAIALAGHSTSPSTTSTARSSCSAGSAAARRGPRCTSAWNSGDAPGHRRGRAEAGPDEQADGRHHRRRQPGGRRRRRAGTTPPPPRTRPAARPTSAGRRAMSRRPRVVRRALGVGDARSGGHPVHAAGLDALHRAGRVAMDERAVEQVGDRRQPDVGVRRDVRPGPATAPRGRGGRRR